MAGCVSQNVQNKPATGSAALAFDEEISRRSFALRDTPRWLLAASDADLYFPHAAGTFSCALNVPITEEDTPHLYMLLHRTLTDFDISTRTAKSHYKRACPFLWNKEPICTPKDQAFLETELAAVRKKGLKPHRDCGAESTALAVKPSLAQ